MPKKVFDIGPWFDATKATKGDVPGYYCFGFNAKWNAPRIRVGYYDALDDGPHGNGPGHRFKCAGDGCYMDPNPSHIANMPKDPFSVEPEFSKEPGR